MKNIFEIENLSKQYPSFLLDNVSFKEQEGRIMGFIGRNGAGKSTTLKSILNLVHADNGSVKILDLDMRDNETEIKGQIGFVLGGIDFYINKKLKDITNVTKRFYPLWEDSIYHEYLKAFNLDENKRIKELSAGMKVKYSLTLALSHKAKLLILDEPTSGLDPISRDELLEIFISLVKKENITILFSTHITSDLEKCADDITYIKQGKIIFTGTRKELLDEYLLIKDNDENVSDSIREKCISFRVNLDGVFEGLISSANKISGVKVEKPNLEDIMIFSERTKTL